MLPSDMCSVHGDEQDYHLRELIRFGLAAKVEKTSIERIVHAGQEGRCVGAKIESKRGDFMWLGHSADRLRMGKLGEHFFLPAGIVLAQVPINKRRVNASGRDAIAADVAGEVVLGHRIGHCDYGALARRISKSVGQTRGAGNRSHVQNNATAVCFHVVNGGEHAVIDTLHVHLKNTIEVALAGRFEFANVRDAGIVHQGVDAAALGEFAKYGVHLLVVRDITFVRERVTAGNANFLGRILRPFRMDVENVHTRPAGRKKVGDRSTDAARAARNDRRFAVEVKPVRIGAEAIQRDSCSP